MFVSIFDSSDNNK